MIRPTIATLFCCALALVAGGPSTQPATAEQYPALMKKLRDAQSENERLAAEIDRLNVVIERMRLELAEMRKEQPDQPARTQRPSLERAKEILVSDLKPGVQRKRVHELLGEEFSITREGSLVVEEFRWFFEVPNDGKQRSGSNYYYIKCFFDDQDALTGVTSGHD